MARKPNRRAARRRELIAEMSHAERMAMLMRELRSPTAPATARAIIAQIEREMKEIEEGLEIARRLAGAEQKASEK